LNFKLKYLRKSAGDAARSSGLFLLIFKINLLVLRETNLQYT